MDEYNDPKTQEYQELVTNLTIELRKVYEKVDGFVGIRILFLKRGSVICSYIVILAKNSRVKHEELAKIVEQANRTFAFKVKSVKVEEEPTDGSTKEPVEKLPEWALITMIVLGSLTFIFLVIAICVCVSIHICNKLLTFLVLFSDTFYTYNHCMEGRPSCRCFQLVASISNFGGFSALMSHSAPVTVLIYKAISPLKQ